MQGVPGAYSEMAAIKACPGWEPLPCEQFETAFQALSQVRTAACGLAGHMCTLQRGSRAGPGACGRQWCSGAGAAGAPVLLVPLGGPSVQQTTRLQHCTWVCCVPPRHLAISACRHWDQGTVEASACTHLPAPLPAGTPAPPPPLIMRFAALLHPPLPPTAAAAAATACSGWRSAPLCRWRTRWAAASTLCTTCCCGTACTSWERCRVSGGATPPASCGARAAACPLLHVQGQPGAA